jgi:hypothetical protein
MVHAHANTVTLDDVMLDETEEARLLGDIPDDMNKLEGAMFPLVITFKKFLTMLDGSLAKPFFPKDGKSTELFVTACLVATSETTLLSWNLPLFYY